MPIVVRRRHAELTELGVEPTETPQPSRLSRVFVRHEAPPPATGAVIARKAVAVALDPKRGGDLAPGERPQVETLVKAMQYASGWTERSATPVGAREMRPVSAAVVARRAAEQLAPSSSITPLDIALAMQAQGIDFVQPFAPGRPLQPYYGYNRRPRQFDYQTARNTTTTTRPDRMPFRTLLQLWKSYDVAQICVAPETEVVLRRGVVPIPEVKVGDLTLTHEGRWRRVLDVMAHPVGDRRVYRVESSGLDPLVATGEHPMFVARYTHTQSHKRLMREMDFVNVADLEPRGTAQNARWHYDGAVLPALDDRGDGTFDLLPWLPGGFAESDGKIVRPGVGGGRLVSVPAQVAYSEELGRLLGWYLAEGSQSHGVGLDFGLGPEERPYAEQILADAESVFGIRGSYAPYRVGRGFKVSIANSVVARLFACGTARTKHIPEWAWAGGSQFLRAVLGAWALGDGCTVERNGWAQRTVVVTASHTLAWQMRLIAIALGLKPSIKRKPGGNVAVIRGAEVVSGPSYHVEWGEKPQATGWYSFEGGGRYLATAIRSVEEIPYGGLVYNLSVEEDESYVTTAGTVHNCYRYSANSLRSMRVRFGAMEGYEKNPVKEIAEAKRVLRRPDGKRLFRSFLAQNQRNLWIFDSAPIFRLRDKAGRLKHLKNFSAMTLAPMLDYFGDFPDAPAPAFQQFITGIPWDWLTWKDVIYEPFWPETDSPYGTPPLETVLINANCYSDDTEVLTDRGWLRFADVDIAKDKFATRNPDTARFEWQSATKYHEAGSDGTMYRAASKNVDVLVTGGHRMLVDRLPKGCPGVKHGNEWLVHAEDLYEYQSALSKGGAGVRCPATSAWDAPDLEWFSLPTTAADLVFLDGAAVRAARGARSVNSVAAQAGVSRPTLRRAETEERLRRSCAEAICNVYGLPLSVIREDPHYFSEGIEGDDFAAFMGMYLSEGCVRSDGPNIAIAQEEYSKGYVEFRDLLARMLGREAPYHRGAFTFGHAALADYLRPFGKAHEKYVPREVLDMSRRQLEIFWRFYVLGDGAIYPRTEIVTTVSKRMADGLQEVLQKIGYSASVRPVGTPAKPTHHQRWQVQTRLKEAYRVDVERVAYEGNVYCVSVPNKTLYVRRNGYPTWCANTDIRLQLFFLDFFTKGQVPEAIARAPEDMTSPDDLADFQEQWTADTYGTQAQRWGLKWLPHGTEIDFYKPMVFDPDLAEYVMRRTVAAHLLTPQNLGILEDVNRATATTQVDQEFRVSTLPIVGYYEDLLDSVLQDTLTLPVQIRFDTGREKEDRLTDVQAWSLGVQWGMVSPTEGRDKLFNLPVNPEERVGRGILDNRLGWIPLAHMLAVSGDLDILTAAPKAGSVEPQPYQLPSDAHPVPAAGPGAAGGVGGTATSAPPSWASGDARPKGDPTKAYPRPLALQRAAKHAATADETQVESSPIVAEGYGRWGEPHGSSAQGTGAVGPVELLDEADDLKKWHRQSKRRVADGKAPRLFVSEAIRFPVADRVWKALEGARTRADVDAAFKQARPIAGGIVMQAEDTGRVLLIQRTPDHHDPDEAYCRWELPGGHLDTHDPWTGARHEWEEETGSPLPLGARHLGNWTSPDGVYVGFAMITPRESDVRLHPQPEEVSQARWWAKEDLDNPEVRDKVTETLTRVVPLLKGWTSQPRRATGRFTTENEAKRAKAHADTTAAIQRLVPRVRQALVASLPTAALTTAVSVAGAGAGAISATMTMIGNALNLSLLPAVVGAIYADGYAAGVREGAALGGVAVTGTPDLTPAEWTQEIGGTVLGRIEHLVQEGVAAGQSREQIGSAIEAYLASESHATEIADTEFMRAWAQGAMASYRAGAVVQLAWINQPGACSRCMENVAASPQPAADPQWPEGPIPVHPHTRCLVVPFVEA